MAGKRLLDAAKLLDAGRGIGKQHIVLRQQQLDVYSKTSSLANAVKTQTDRVTVTAGAAYELARRFNETGPSWQEQPSGRAQQHESESYAPEQETKVTTRTVDAGSSAESQAVDHARRSAATKQTAQGPLGEQEGDDGTLSSLRKRELQRIAERQIPTATAEPRGPSLSVGQDTFSERPSIVSPELSSLPRTKIPKHPEEGQRSDSHVADRDINQEVFYTAGNDSEAGDGEKQTPEEAGSDALSSTPRLSLMLGTTKSNAKNPYAAKQKLPPKPLPEMIEAEKRWKSEREVVAASQQRFGPREPGAGGAKGESEIQKLAESIAQDAEVCTIKYRDSLPPKSLLKSCLVDPNKVFSWCRRTTTT